MNDTVNELLKELILLNRVASKQKIKPLWVVSKLHKKYGSKLVRSKEVLPYIAEALSIKKQRIIWFISTKLENKV